MFTSNLIKLFLFLILYSSNALASVTFDNKSTTGTVTNGTTITLSLTETTNANRYLVVWCYYSSSHPPTSVTYAGVNLNSEATFTVAGTRIENLYDLIAPATGTNNIVVTFPANVGNGICGGQSAYGVDQLNPIHYITITSIGTSSISTPSLTIPSFSGDLAMSATVWSSSTITDTVDASWTSDFNGTGGGSATNIAAAHKSGAGPSVTRSDTLSSATNCAIIGEDIRPVKGSTIFSPTSIIRRNSILN